jgi:hypothetical protein
MDYWHPAGFGKKVERLSSEGIIKTIICKEGRNYKNRPQEESWFIVWEKQ